MKKLSVIIPVFNVRDYLDDCLASVCNQTLTDLEIICVNDGSTDDSPEILERWAKQDSRIQVINQKNAGLSAARNAGMKHATGEYIAFLDSDDWLEHDFYQVLYDNAKQHNADISVGNVIYYHNDSWMYFGWLFYRTFVGNKRRLLTKTSEKQNLLQSCACWNKIYKRDLIADMAFYVGKMVEDFPFTFMAIARARKIVLCPFTHLYYRQREDSIMANPTKQVRNAFDVLDNYIRLHGEVKQLQTPELDFYTQVFQAFAISNTLAWSGRVRDKKTRHEFFDRFANFVRTFEKPIAPLANRFIRMVYQSMTSKVLGKLFKFDYNEYKIEYWFLGILPIMKFKIYGDKLKGLLFCIIPVIKIRN